MNNLVHIPVLRQSVQFFLQLTPGKIAVDCTLGLGGHAHDMLEAVGAKGLVYAFDQDENHISIARENLKQYSNLKTFHSNFEHLQQCLEGEGVTQVDSILLDLGLASPHVDIAERGFSFLREGPLDMRFDTSADVETAAEIINRWPQKDLEYIFREYGEERYASRIARAIVEDRKLNPFQTTTQLGDLIVRLYPPKDRHGHTHPATRVFQALRIAVNKEIEVLEKVLPQAVELLRPSGRLVVISYHSLEDRVVKHFLKSQAASCICPPEVLRCECRGKPIVKILTKKPAEPTQEEIVQNPRSRSAKLRAAEKN